jgi:hypothetical protein
MRNVALAALLVSLAGPAMASTPGAGECCEATVDVYLTIMPYCCVQLTGDIEVIIDEESCQGPGPFIGCGATEVWACANFPAILSGHMDIDPAAPGIWSALIDGQEQLPFGPGQYQGLVTICLEEIYCDDYAREMDWVGTLTVTVCPEIF